MMDLLTQLMTRLVAVADGDPSLRDEGGFSTAELLGNAALAIVAIAAIWGAMETLGLDVVAWIRAQIIS